MPPTVAPPVPPTRPPAATSPGKDARPRTPTPAVGSTLPARRLALCACLGLGAAIAHAGGPPINAYVIPLKLRPVLFTGTMAFFFFFINIANLNDWNQCWRNRST